MRNDAGHRPGWSELFQAHLFARLALVCFGVWLHAADGLLVATMIPAIVADIGGAEFIAWTIALYEVGSIVAGATAALLAFRHGLRNAMGGAVLIYAAGCVISALAPTMPLMLIGRLLQGLGGGGMVALAFIAQSRLFPRRMMPRVMAALSAVWGVSAFLGPLVGGLFVELSLWRGGFWFFAAQALLLAIWIASGLRDPAATETSISHPRIPYWRLSSLSLGVVAIAAAGIDVSPVRSPLLVSAGAGLLVLFLRLDGQRQIDRLLPTRPFDPRHGTGAALTMILCFASATVAISVYGPVLMTVLLNVSALTAGYVIALSSIGWSVMAVVVSGAAERHDRALIFSGMCILALSVVGFMITVPRGPLALIALFAFLEGAGFGMAWTFVLRRGIALAADEERDRFASALPTVQRLGYAIGAAIAGIVANAAGFGETMGVAPARSAGFWIFAASLPIAGIGLAAAWSFVRAPIRR
jgi:MFS family permease